MFIKDMNRCEHDSQRFPTITCMWRMVYFSMFQEVEKKEKSDGFRKIRKTSPVEPVQLESYFYLSTDWDTAEICPEVWTKLHFCSLHHNIETAKILKFP